MRQTIKPATRIMRSRKPGARMPEGAIYVGRPTLWGNPFMDKRFGHARSVILHRAWLRGDVGDLMLERLKFCPAEIDTIHRKRSATLARAHTLAGHDLACWCPVSSQWCHADTLLAISAEYADYESHCI